ncbi:MAG TPA: hypothetical protein VLD58_07540, partial [Gemmatimonadales bacterium]|nr:hypothetical protein [Gemmatimonadales bacterium]
MTQSNTDAKGNTTAVAVGGDMAFDQHGNPTKLKVNAGVTRNGKSVSVSGGYEVHATEPREEGGRWVVDWERKLTAGGKGGAKGVSASAEYQSSQFGSRSFKTQAEAVTFQENAATMLPSASHDPSTVAGAMHLEIGEMRGASEGTTLGASAAISPTAGSIGAGAQRSSSSGVKVRRLSPAVFELTKEHGTAGGESLSASTLGAGATGHRERDETASTTIRVDLTTPEGKAAFERFSQSGEVGPGARVVSSSVVKGEQSGTTVSMPGFSHDRTGRTEEELTYDEQGKKERYSGIASESISSSIPWAKGHDNSSMRIDSTELNDRQSYYSITGSVDSTEGRKSFEHLAQMTGTVTRDASNAKSSGKWGVEVEITEEIVDAFLARVGSEEVRQAGIFDQTSRNQLRERLRDAKTSDDRKRALAQFFAEGQEGKGIQAVRDTIFGVRNQWAMSTDYEMMKSNKGGNFNYDLT